MRLYKAEIFLIGIVLSLCDSSQEVHYVKPDGFVNCTASSQNCLTLEEYALKAANYFITSSTFLFLAGNHSIRTTVNITDVSEVSFKAETHDMASSILCEGQASILCKNVTNLTLTGLVFKLISQARDSSALSFFNCQRIEISGVLFQGSGDLSNGFARGIYTLYSQLTIIDCNFEGNTGYNGGAIYASAGSNITLAGNTFTGNIAGDSGGALYAIDQSIVLLAVNMGNIFANNLGKALGGAIRLKNSMMDIESTSILNIENATNYMRNSTHTFVNNQAKYGGALALHDSVSYYVSANLVIVFANNTARDSGGAVHLYSTGYPFTRRTMIIFKVKSLRFSQNTAEDFGGGIYSLRSYLSLRNASNGSRYYFLKNSAGQGGGVYSKEGNFEIIDRCTFEGNFASKTTGGAADIIFGYFSLSGPARFIDNSAMVSGGALAFSDVLSALLSGGKILLVRNTAEFGGGVISYNSHIEVHANFTSNAASSRGGGIAIQSSDKTVEIAGQFAANHAECGGAIFIEGGNNVTFKSIHAEGNSGAAVCVSDSDVSFIENTTIENNYGGGGLSSTYSFVSFRNHVTFENNSRLEGGALYSLFGTLVFDWVTVFCSNRAEKDGGAIYAIGSNITFNRMVTATYNTAQNGGVMFLKNGATVNLLQGSTLSSSHNHALSHGGVIYNEDSPNTVQCNLNISGRQAPEVLITLPHCFMRLKGIVSRFSVPFTLLSSNDTSEGESSDYLFGGLLERCQIRVLDPNLQSRSIIPYQLFTTVVLHIEQNNSTSISVSSEPYQLCFCRSDEVFECSQNMKVEAYRGQTINVGLLAIAQGGVLTSALVKASLGNNARLQLKESTQSLQNTCTKLEYTMYSTKDHADLVLYPQGPCHDTGLARVIINVTLRACPDGFVQKGEQCDCDERLRNDYVGHIDCIVTTDTLQIQKRSGSRLWIRGDYTNETYQGLILSDKCPAHYCKAGSVNVSVQNSNTQCNKGRVGLLCGACCTNYSLLLGTSGCDQCTNSYLALLLPFAAAGIALVIFISALRLTVAAGMISSIIFYANIFQANKHTFLPSNNVNVLTVFIAWMNLDLGIETCFYNGMTAFAQTWLQFVFPVYIWLLVGVIVIASRHSITVSRLIGHNPTAVLATLLLMSYTKILRIMVDVYSYVYLFYPDNDKIKVWLKDANVPYLHSSHLVLTVVSSLVLIFLFSPYTLLLLIGYKLQRFSSKKCFVWLNRLKPFLDSYYATYKPHTRYWTGFLLLVRCALYLVLSYNSLRVTSVVVILTLSATLTKGWIFRGVYEKTHLDIVESSVHLNLIVLSTLTFAESNHPAAVYTLLSVVFATMMGIIAFKFYGIYVPKFLLCIKRGAHRMKLIVLSLKKMHSDPLMEHSPQEENVPKTVSTSYVNLKAL